MSEDFTFERDPYRAELVFIPAGADPIPLFLTEVEDRDVNDLVDDRERRTVVATLRTALRQFGNDPQQLVEDAERVGSMWRDSPATRAMLDAGGFHGLTWALDKLASQEGAP